MKKTKIVTIRADADLHAQFRQKAQLELNKTPADFIREMMLAFVEDRLKIETKGNVYES